MEPCVTQKQSLLFQRIQPLLLAVVAPLILGVFGWIYLGHVQGLLVQEMQRSLDYTAAQGASIIDARLQGRVMALGTLAAHPALRDPGVNTETKLKLLLSDMNRRGLIRIGLATLDGMSYTTDGHSLFVGDREFFHEAKKGAPYISGVLVCKISGELMVVHSVPVRNGEGKVQWVLYASERADRLSENLNVRFAYDSMGGSVIVDGNGVTLNATSLRGGNFFGKFTEENGASTLTSFRAQLDNVMAPMTIYIYNGQQVFVRSARVSEDSGWHLLLMVPEDAAGARLAPLLNLTLVALFVIALLLLGCGLYIIALRRGYVRQRGFTAAAIHAAGIYQLEVEKDGRITSCNALFRQRMGWSDHEELPCIQDLGPECQQGDVLQSLENDGLFSQKLYSPKGKTLHVQWHAMAGRHSGQQVLLGTDFSEREEVREQQRGLATMRDMQNIFDNIPFPMALRNVDNTLRLANRCLFALVGEEGLHEGTLRFGGRVPTEEYGKLNEALEQVVKTKTTVLTQHSLMQLDGSQRRYENTQTPLLDERGEVTGVVSISVDVTDSLRVQELLTQEVQRLRSLLDSSPVGVVIVVGGKVRFRNLRARQLVGLEVGSNVWDVTVSEGNSTELVHLLKKKTVVRDVPFSLLDPQRRMRHLLVTGSRTMLEGEEATLLWAVDVTPLKTIEGQLIQARDAAEAATRAKSDFLATMSHEIRTPMNAVLGFVHLFERDNLSEHQRDYLEKISISAAGLLRIINDILDFSKIEAGKLEMEQVPFYLAACIDATHSIIGFSAREKGLVLTTRVDKDVPVVISGDRQRLNQVLINLLNNAVKFTEKGSVRLEVSVRQHFDDGTLELVFSVSDTGIGMNEEQISRIFQPFSQADTSTSRKYGGTGLGLVISRRLVQLMGGEIEATSNEQGTTFSFTIRVKACRPEEVPASGAALFEQGVASMDHLRGLPVLVAEDNEINQEIAGAMLKQWGMVPFFAHDGQEAVDMVMENDYVLVFMDMQMPGVDGLEATRRIRALSDQKPSLRALPIVAMTANAMLNDRRRCLEAGMNDHLGKPIDPEQMRKQLLHWVK